MLCYQCATELNLNIPTGRVNPELIDVDPELIYNCQSCGWGSMDFGMYHLLKSKETI